MKCVHQSNGTASSSGRVRQEVTRRPESLRETEELAQVAERILQNINAVFAKDDSLDEFDIVPQESQANRSPVIHTDHKLALESWCVPFLYTHSFGCFLEVRPRKGAQARNPFLSVNASNGSTPRGLSELSEDERRIRALELSRVLVLLNPDLSLAWNFRRDNFQPGGLDLDNELHLVTLCATRKPKCSEGFSYRRWLVQNAITQGTIKMDQSLEFFELEANASIQAATKYLSNYHAWNYRLFLLENWMKNKDVPANLKQTILSNEKYASDTWLKTHISDYCGFHYRQKLLTHLIASEDDRSSKETVLQNELADNRQSILFYPGHESLWYHRRNIIKQLRDLLKVGKVVDLKWLQDGEQELVQLASSKHLAEASVVENQARKDISFVDEDCSQLNHLYSQRYLKWIRMCLDWDIAG